MPVVEPYCVQCKHHFVAVKNITITEGHLWWKTTRTEERRVHMCDALANLITGQTEPRLCTHLRGVNGYCGHEGKYFANASKEQA